MANEFTGKNLYLIFGSTVLTGRYKSFEANEEIGVVDASAGSDTARTKLVTLEDGTATFEFLLTADQTALWGAVAKGTFGTLEWAPEGTASTKPKHKVYCLVKSRKKSFVHEDVSKGNVEFEFSGAVADSAY